MLFPRGFLALALLSALTGCGYVHFGRLPAPAPAADSTGEAYSNLLTEHKILKQELALARKEGETLRDALDHGPGSGSPELIGQLNQATRELAALRVSYAKLQAERAGAASPAANLHVAELEEKLAAAQRDNAQLRADIDRARAENATLAAQLKSAHAQSEQVQSAFAQLNAELIAQKDARARAEQATAALNTQLGTVLARRDTIESPAREATASPPAAPTETAPTPAATSALALTKAPPADSSPIAELRTSLARLRTVDPAPASPPAPQRKHVVQPGETLEKIAAKYYGDPKRWIQLYSANNDLLRDGRPLAPGMELAVPEN